MNPYNIMVVIFVMFMAYLILIPLGQTVIQALTLADVDTARIDRGREGIFTLYYWRRILTSSISRKMLWMLLKNSLLVPVCTAALGITLDSLLAWLMVHSDLPYKRFLFLALIIPYMALSWRKSMAQFTIFKNERVGGAQGLLGFLGTQTPDWLTYGLFAIVATLVIHHYAYAYLLVSSALSPISPELEEVGGILGASKARVPTKITLLLMMPAILSTIVMTFLKAIDTFGIPPVLRPRTRYYTISIIMYNSIQNGQNRTAFATFPVLVVIASFSVLLNQKAIGSRKSPSTIGGKGNRSNPIRLGKWGPIIVGISIALIVVAMAFPVVILLYQFFMLEPGNCSLNNFTLHHWTGDSVPTINRGEPGIFRNPQFIKYVVNTIKLVILTSPFVTVSGQLIGYINPRGRKLFLGKLVEQLVFMLYLVPPTTFGAIYLALFTTVKRIEMMGYRITPVPSLYGTFILLVFIAVVKSMSLTSRAGTSSMLQINTELEEAAQVENAGFLRRFFKVVFPLSKGDIIDGFVLVFISTMKELSLTVVLMTPSQQTLSHMTYAYSMENLIQLPSAVTIVMFVLVSFVYWFANIFTNADIIKDF